MLPELLASSGTPARVKPAARKLTKRLHNPKNKARAQLAERAQRSIHNWD